MLANVSVTDQHGHIEYQRLKWMILSNTDEFANNFEWLEMFCLRRNVNVFYGLHKLQRCVEQFKELHDNKKTILHFNTLLGDYVENTWHISKKEWRKRMKDIMTKKVNNKKNKDYITTLFKKSVVYKVKPTLGI